MNNLESVIRPFAAGDVFTARLLPALQPNFDAKPPVTQLYGNPITLQSKAIGITNLIGGVKLKEINRTTRTVRVFNREDPSQFVDVEQLLSMTLKDQNSGQQHNFTFNPGNP